MTIKLNHIYDNYPNELKMYQLLESIYWKNGPVCPYCKSKKITKLKSNFRLHCNNCNTSFSLTVNTFMHRTKVDLRKWVYLVILLSSPNSKVSLRDLGLELELTKDTVLRMSKKIKSRYLTDKIFFENIINQIHYGK